MSVYQKRVLYRSVIIGAVWIFFAQKFLFVWWRVSISGFLTIVSLGLRMWWRQDGMWTFALMLSIITFIGFLFGVIPVYTARPTLDAFYATKFPTIQCIQDKIPSSLSLWKIEYTAKSLPSINDVCNRAFPVYVGQLISRKDTGAVVVDLGNASSIYLEGPIVWMIAKNSTWYVFDRKQATGRAVFYWSNDSNYAIESIQYTIKNSFEQEKKTYLKKNFPRAREQSVWLTKIAIYKMKILGLLNREFNNYVKNLEYYMQEVSN